MNEAQEKCKYCGRDLNDREIYEICGCIKSREEILLKINKTYTKLDCVATENCKSSKETIHKK
jgi:hypothetical protein